MRAGRAGRRQPPKQSSFVSPLTLVHVHVGDWVHPADEAGQTQLQVGADVHEVGDGSHEYMVVGVPMPPT